MYGRKKQAFVKRLAGIHTADVSIFRVYLQTLAFLGYISKHWRGHQMLNHFWAICFNQRVPVLVWTCWLSDANHDAPNRPLEYFGLPTTDKFSISRSSRNGRRALHSRQ